MGGDDGHSAARPVFAQCRQKPCDGIGIERHGRLVEQPEPPGRDEQTGEAEPALLARRSR